MSEKDEQTAAQKHAAERRADHIRALEDERKGYVARGLDDRVEQVDEQIRLAKREVSGRSANASGKAAPAKTEKRG